MKPLMGSAALVLLAFCLLVPASVNGQVGSLRVGMPSPTAASLGKFGDIPVSLYTGTPNISVPLYEVKGRTLSLPITLSYQASGIKVDEIPGWVGMGWALSAGGVITRSMVGLPDDSPNGYMHTGDQLETTWNNIDYVFLQHIGDESIDVEPDRFFFNFPGGSGQFVMKDESDIRSIPLRKLKIETIAHQGSCPVSGGPIIFDCIEGWTITTEDGTKYTFGGRDAGGNNIGLETAKLNSTTLPGDRYVSSWYLTKIESALGDDEITLTYTAPAVIVSREDREYQEYYYPLAGNCTLETDVTHQNFDNLDVIWLDTITSDLGTVAFVTAARTDFPEEMKLDFIQAKSPSGDLIKHYALGYDYYQNTRLRLRSVQEIDPQNPTNDLPPYAFSYNETNLPARLSDAIDHWGYANGKTSNTGTVPPVYFEYFTGQYGYFQGDYADRHVDTTMVKAGVLERIDYPTGGHTLFTFESNEYSQVGDALVEYDYSERQHETVGLPQGGDVSDEFSVRSADTEPIPLRFMVDYTLDEDNGNCKGVPGCVYFILKKSGVDVQTWSAFEIAPNGKTETIIYLVTDDADDYTLETGADTKGDRSIQVEVSWRNKIDATTKKGGGLRVQRMESHDGMGNPPIVKTYAYRAGPISSGVIINEPRYHYRTSPIGQTCTYASLSAMSRLPLGSTQGGTVGYSDVTVTHGAGGEGGSTHYTFRTPADELDEMLTTEEWPFGLTESRDWKRGQMVARIDHSATAIQATQDNTYFFSEDTSLPQIARKYKALTVKKGPQEQPSGTFIYSFRQYEIMSGWVHPEIETVTVYDQSGANSVATTRTYHYDDLDHLQLTKLEEEHNDGRVRTTEFEYAHEQHQTGMAAVNMLSQVYSQTVSEGGGVQAKQWTTWRSDNGHWLPDKTWVWESGSPSSPPSSSNAIRTTSFEEYDDYGRVLRQWDALDREVTFEYQEPNNDNLFLSKVQQGNLSVDYTYYNAGHKWGLLHQIADENDNATTYDYDSFRRLDEVTTPLGATTTISYNLDFVPNFITTTADLDNNRDLVTEEFFDGLGRPILTQLDEGGGNHILAKIDYNALGRVAKTWKPYRDEDQSGQYDEQEAKADYEALPNCNAATPYVETSYLPDPLGRVAETNPEYCDGNQRALTNSYGVEAVTSLGGDYYAYTQATDEDSKKTRVYTDTFGNQMRMVAGVGTPEVTVTEMDYDILGNLVAVKPPNYTCDSNSNPECDTPGDDNWKTTYEYDARSLLIEKNTPDTDAPFNYAYDDKGNLRFVVDPRRQSGGFLYTDYDQFDRVVETGLCMSSSPPSDPNDTPTSCSKEEVVIYTYDMYDSPPLEAKPTGVNEANPKGHLTQVKFDVNNYYQYFYDDDGRVVDFYVHLVGLGSKLVEYDYDLQGNVTQARYQAGDNDEDLELKYTYDDAGRLEKVESKTYDDASFIQEASYTYTPTGQVEQLQLGNAPTAIPPIDYTYHIRDWLTKINDPANLGSDKFAMALGYDEPAFPGAPTYNNGNVGSIEWHTEGNNIVASRVGYAFDYDALNRLETADFQKYDSGWTNDDAYNVGVGTPINYDPNGNIQSLTRHTLDAQGLPALVTLGYTYANSNRLQNITGIPCIGGSPCFDYDANGNMTQSRVAENIVHDRRNLPLSMDIGTDQLTFGYDADGQRIYKQLDTGGNNGIETFYLRGLGGSVLAVYVDDGQGSGPQLQYWNILVGGAVIGRIVPASGSN